MPILRYDDEPIAIDGRSGDSLDFVTIPAFFVPVLTVDAIAANSVERLGHEDDLNNVPPYTRYPEEDPTVYGGAPTAETDHGMPLMHTTLRPLPITDETDLERQRNRMSGISLMQTTSNSTGMMDMTRKSWREKTWKEKRKTKVCGIPFWWILLSIFTFVLMAAIIGGVVGGYTSGSRGS